MLSYNTYKVIHLVAVMGLFLALGGFMGSETGRARWAGAIHGIAMLVMFVAGFAMLGKMGIHSSFPGWVIGKMMVWLIFGVAMVLAKRKLVPRLILVPSLLFLGGLSAYLAIWKP